MDERRGQTLVANLYNMRARWYDTQSQVFTTVDPAVSSTNQPYQFANGDPVNNSDPSGLWTHGYCLSGAVQALAGTVGASGTACAVINYQSQPALLTTVSTNIGQSGVRNFLNNITSELQNAVGGANVMASFYVAFTDSLRAQTGNFNSYFGSAGLGKWLAIQGTYFYGIAGSAGKCGTTRRGGTTGGMIGISAGVALGIPIPVAGGSSTYTMNSVPLTGTEGSLIVAGVNALDVTVNPVLSTSFNTANSFQENF